MTTTGAPADPYDPMTVLVKTLQEVQWDLTSGAASASNADWEQLARLILQQLRDAREPGWHIEIAVCDAPEAEAQAFIDAVADLAMTYEPRTGWDPFMLATGVGPEHRFAASDSPPVGQRPGVTAGLGLLSPRVDPNPAPEVGAE